MIVRGIYHAVKTFRHHKFSIDSEQSPEKNEHKECNGKHEGGKIPISCPENLTSIRIRCHFTFILVKSPKVVRREEDGHIMEILLLECMVI